MNTMIRHFVLAGLALIGLGLTGCVKLKQIVTVMPDGSGSIELNIGLSQQAMEFTAQDGGDPFEDLQPEVVQERMQGIVAFSQPTTREIDGYTYLSYKAYFEDINDVRMTGNDQEDLPMTFSYTRDGDAAELVVNGGMILSSTAEYEKPAEEDIEIMRNFFVGMSFEEQFVLPGAVSAPDAVETQGNTASLTINLDNMIEGTGPIEDLAGEDSLTFEVAEIDTPAQDIEAFNAEMQEAVEWWQAQQQ